MGWFSDKKKLRQEVERLRDELSTTAEQSRQGQREQRKQVERANYERNEARRQEEAQRREAEIARIERNDARLQEEAQRMEAQRQEEARQTRKADQQRQKEIKLMLQRQNEERKMQALKAASSETLRTLRGLIRQRYALDCEIWGLRNCRKPNRYIVEEKMTQSDNAFGDIMLMIEAWGDNSDGRWTPEEWTRVVEIRRRLQSEGKRVWHGNPPWNERSTEY